MAIIQLINREEVKVKRFLLTFISIGLILCFVACSQNLQVDHAFVCGYSDSVPEIVSKLDYAEWSRDPYYDRKQLETIKVSVGEIDYCGTYIESEHNYGTYETRHSYLDNSKKVFEINDDGVLSAYFWGTDNSLHEVKNMEECRNIALDFISNLFGSYPSNHVERISFDDKRNMYTFEYIKNIRGVESEDKLTIVVENNGHIYSFRSSLWEKIQENQVPVFNLDKIQNTISEKLDEITITVRDSYDLVEYKDYCYSITMITNSRYAILCDVNVYCINRYGEFDEQKCEKIRFVVPLD